MAKRFTTLALAEDTARLLAAMASNQRPWEVRWRPGHPVSYSPPGLPRTQAFLDDSKRYRGPVAEFTCWGRVAATSLPLPRGAGAEPAAALAPGCQPDEGQMGEAKSAFRRNAAEHLHQVEAAHNPEAAGPNLAPLLRKALETALFVHLGSQAVAIPAS